AYLDPHFLFNSISASIVCSVVLGEHFNYQDPRLLQLLHLMNEIFIILYSSYAQVFEIFPGILKHFPGTHTCLYSMIQEVKDFITENMERHQKMLDPSGPKDFIDSFLLLMDKEHSDPESEFRQQNLVHMVFSLFFAGTETSSSTLCFGFLLLLKNPDVLGKPICLSEGISHTKLFLFFTAILQNFSTSEDIDLIPQDSGVGKVSLMFQIHFLPHQRG
ncbi:hypothetical protein Celaphus_00004374, partial [Cervus elaphus hippelaphus]